VGERGIVCMPKKNSNPQRTSRSIENSISPQDSLQQDSYFHCSVEWHLARLTSRFAPILYHFARRLSSRSGVFSASMERVAEHFGVDRNTADRAAEELACVGLFGLLQVERFKPNAYRVVDHKKWAQRHPGQCVQKASYPWDGEGDPLGRQLYAISGQRVQFLPNQTTGLRNLGFSDEEIIEEFRTFLDESDYEGKRWKYAYWDFHARLKALTASRPKARITSVADADTSVTVPHGRGTTVPHGRGMDRAPCVPPSCPTGRAQVLDMSLRRE
jgi:hypothetical protein